MSLPEEGQAGRQAEFLRGAFARLTPLGHAVDASPVFRMGEREEPEVKIAVLVVVRGMAACMARVARGEFV